MEKPKAAALLQQNTKNSQSNIAKPFKLLIDGCEVTLVFSEEPNCEIAELVKNVLLDSYFQNNRAL